MRETIFSKIAREIAIEKMAGMEDTYQSLDLSKFKEPWLPTAVDVEKNIKDVSDKLLMKNPEYRVKETHDRFIDKVQEDLRSKGKEISDVQAKMDAYTNKAREAESTARRAGLDPDYSESSGVRSKYESKINDLKRRLDADATSSISRAKKLSDAADLYKKVWYGDLR